MDPTGKLELNTIAALAARRTPRSVREGEVIFRQGEAGEHLYGVVRGEIDLCWDGERVETIGAGSCFGAGALVDPEHRRFTTAIARSDADLLEMNREEFLFAMHELPMFGLEMLHDLELRLQKPKHHKSEA
jgi:CRP/FNR family cyclic AMP-dependent transcriptional regulator